MTSFYYIYFLDGKAHYIFIKAHGTVQAVAMARKIAPYAIGRGWVCVHARRRNIREGVRALLAAESVE